MRIEQKTLTFFSACTRDARKKSESSSEQWNNTNLFVVAESVVTESPLGDRLLLEYQDV